MPGGGGGCLPPMDLMRSEEMQLLQVIIPTESAHLAVSNLGDLGLATRVEKVNRELDPTSPLSLSPSILSFL